jgi:hypothetical protein
MASVGRPNPCRSLSPPFAFQPYHKGLNVRCETGDSGQICDKFAGQILRERRQTDEFNISDGSSNISVRELWGNDLQRLSHLPLLLSACRPQCSGGISGHPEKSEQRRKHGQVDQECGRRHVGFCWVRIGFWHSLAGSLGLYLSHSTIADLLADKLRGTENCRCRLRKNQARSANRAAALAAREFHSNPYYHRPGSVVMNRG